MRRIWIGLAGLGLAALACNPNPGTVAEPSPSATVGADAVVETAPTETPTQVVETATGEPTAVPPTAVPPTPVPPTPVPPTPVPPTPVPPTDEPPQPQPVDWPLVQQGAQGARTAAIQYLLRDEGYTIDVDGMFGPMTKATVQQFQSDNGLAADGIVGPQTWGALIQGHTLQQGASGPDVRAVQTLLRDRHGYGINVDGDFGPLTNDAVVDFQTNAIIAVDGIVGPETWKYLVSS